MKKTTNITFLAIFIINICMINELFAQTSEAFEKEIEGIWTVEKMPFANAKEPKTKDFFALQKGAVYNLSVDAVGLNLVINFQDGTSFTGVSLTETSPALKNKGLLNITWKIGTDSKMLKKYGLSEVILAEMPVKEGDKFSIKLTFLKNASKGKVIEKIKEEDKVMTFDCVM